MKHLVKISVILIAIPINIAWGQEVPIANHHPDLQVEKLHILNSDYRETNLSITPDGQYLYFMSLRGGMPWSVKDYALFQGKPRYDGDLWYSKKIDGQWTAPQNLPGTVNTKDAEDEPNISPDGSYVLFQSWRDGWEMDGGPYYISSLFGEVWGKPEGVAGGINQYFKREIRKYEGYATDGAALAPNGEIFLVALAPDYEDSMDIYLSRKSTKGEWTYLKPIDINTDGDERSVFIAGDNKTVYFASNGYGGFGGLDVFKAVLNDDGSFSDIVNIGSPFNSPGDDYSFIVTASGREAYFTRDGDIHYADLSNASPAIKPLPSLVLSGIVSDKFGFPVESNIRLRHIESDKVKARARSNSETGEYSLSFFKEEGTYQQEVEADGLRTIKRAFKLDSLDKYEESHFNLTMVEENVVLLNFEFDSSEILPEHTSILDSLKSEMFANRRLRLLVEGHTDEKGADGYNLELSKARVNAVGKYLQEAGLPAGIMRLDFYGEKRPKVKKNIVNKDAINRRVEIKVIELKKRNR